MNLGTLLFKSKSMSFSLQLSWCIDLSANNKDECFFLVDIKMNVYNHKTLS